MPPIIIAAAIAGTAAVGGALISSNAAGNAANVQLGIFDGVAGDPAHRGRFVAIELSPRDGALVIAQVEKRFGDVVRIEGGAWTYTAAFPSLDQFDASGAPRLVHGNGGLYGLVEGRIITKQGENSGGLSGWLRAGVANGDINRAENYMGAGLVYTGARPGPR